MQFIAGDKKKFRIILQTFHIISSRGSLKGREMRALYSLSVDGRTGTGSEARSLVTSVQGLWSSFVTGATKPDEAVCV